jgi:hypothetical protein
MPREPIFSDRTPFVEKATEHVMGFVVINDNGKEEVLYGSIGELTEIQFDVMESLFFEELHQQNSKLQSALEKATVCCVRWSEGICFIDLGGTFPKKVVQHIKKECDKELPTPLQKALEVVS